MAAKFEGVRLREAQQLARLRDIENLKRFADVEFLRAAGPRSSRFRGR